MSDKRDEFVDLLNQHGTLGDVIVAIHKRILSLEPIAPYIPAIREEYAGRIAPEGSLMDVLTMSDEERAAKLSEQSEAETAEVETEETADDTTDDKPKKKRRR